MKSKDDQVATAYRAFLNWDADHDLGDLDRRREDPTWQGVTRAITAIEEEIRDADSGQLTIAEARCLRAVALGDDDVDPAISTDALDRLELIIEGQAPEGARIKSSGTSRSVEKIRELDRKLESAYELLDEWEVELEALRLPTEEQTRHQASTYKELYHRYLAKYQTICEMMHELESYLGRSHSGYLEIVERPEIRRALRGEPQPMLEAADELTAG